MLLLFAQATSLNHNWAKVFVRDRKLPKALMPFQEGTVAAILLCNIIQLSDVNFLGLDDYI